LPQALVNRLIRLAAFQNPEFYRAQAMRMPVWNKPRVIGCAENYPQHIALPCGCFDAVSELLRDNGIHLELRNERHAGESIAADFVGTLRPVDDNIKRPVSWRRFSRRPRSTTVSWLIWCLPARLEPSD
jgi:hypothetical protein